MESEVASWGPFEMIKGNIDQFMMDSAHEFAVTVGVVDPYLQDPFEDQPDLKLMRRS